MLHLLTALLFAPSSLAAHQCDSHAILRCESQFEFVSRSRGRGPTGSGAFQRTNDGEGNFLCAAYADIIPTGTLLAVHASITDLGNGQRNFSLFVEQKTGYGTVPFTQQDAHTITARIPAEGSPSMVYRGKAENLAAVVVTCRYNP